MKPDPELADALCLGLLAQGFVRTASRGDWRRFGKFRHADAGGIAYYVLPSGDLWWGSLHLTEPKHLVSGPILEQILTLGLRAERPVDGWAERPVLCADTLLKELG